MFTAYHCTSYHPHFQWYDLNLTRKQQQTIMQLRACSAAGSAPHSHCGGREFESPQVHRKKKPPLVGGFFLWYGIHAEEIRTIQCGTDECRRRRLDGAAPFLTNLRKSFLQKPPLVGGFFLWYGIHAEEIRTI